MIQWLHVRYNRAVVRQSRFETISQSVDIDQDFNVGVSLLVSRNSRIEGRRANYGNISKRPSCNVAKLA